MSMGSEIFEEEVEKLRKENARMKTLLLSEIAHLKDWEPVRWLELAKEVINYLEGSSPVVDLKYDVMLVNGVTYRITKRYVCTNHRNILIQSDYLDMRDAEPCPIDKGGKPT